MKELFLNRCLENAQIDRSADVVQALKVWEARERPVIETTQRFAVMLVLVSKLWPENLLDLQSQMVREVLRSKQVEDQMTLAARHVVNLGETLASV